MFIPSKIDKLIEEKQNSISGITVQQMANEMSIPLSTLNNIKNGLATPGVDKLERIANYFGVDMNYFFSNMESKKLDSQPTVQSIINVDFLLDRIENQAKKIGKLEEELKRNSIDLPSYTMQDVPDLKVAEPEEKLKKVDQTQTKTN